MRCVYTSGKLDVCPSIGKELVAARHRMFLNNEGLACYHPRPMEDLYIEHQDKCWSFSTRHDAEDTAEEQGRGGSSRANLHGEQYKVIDAKSDTAFIACTSMCNKYLFRPNKKGGEGGKKTQTQAMD